MKVDKALFLQQYKSSLSIPLLINNGHVSMALPDDVLTARRARILCGEASKKRGNLMIDFGHCQEPLHEPLQCAHSRRVVELNFSLDPNLLEVSFNLRPALGFVAIEQPLRPPAPHHGREFPGQVEGVLEGKVQS